MSSDLTNTLSVAPVSGPEDGQVKPRIRRPYPLVAVLALSLSTLATMGSGGAATDATDYEIIGQIGGAEISFSNTLALGEGQLYLGLGPRLAVVDISDPAHPRVTGQSEILPRAVRGVIARDGRAYVALADGGVAVVDVSDPLRPHVIGRASTGTDAQALALNGHILYVTGNDGDEPASQLLVFDVADPGNIVAMGRMDLAGFCLSIVTRGEFAYVGCGYSGLAVVNLTDPGQPVLEGILPKLDALHDVDLLGPYVVLPGEFELDIVDVANPRAPHSIAHLTLPDIAHGVTVVGDRIYVGYYQGIDAARFQVMDASVPTAPRFISSFKTSGLPIDLVVDKGNAYVTYLQKNQPGSAYLGVLDLRDPAEPKEIGALETVGEVQMVTVQGHVAFAGKNRAVGPSRLHAIDVTDPAQPRLLGTYRGELTSLRGTEASGEYLYAADGLGGLRIIDISDPGHMRLTGQLSFGSAQALDVAVGGDIAYVGTNQGALNLVDVSDREHPVLVGQLPFENPVWTVAADGDTAYIGVGDEGLRIVDVSDPDAPVVVASVPSAGWISDLELRGHLAFAYGSGLTIIDISVPNQPKVLSVTPIRYSSWGMAVDGERLYVAEQSNANRWQAGFRAYDVSDPAAVREIAVVDAPGESWGIAAAGGIVYLADHFTGLSIFRGVETCCSPTAPMPGTPTPVPVGRWFYLPLVSKGHPLAVCRGGMGEGEAVEHAKGEVWMLGLWAPNGGDGNADVVTAERMTAAEHDARYPQDDTLLEDIFPIAPEWSCYWRVELSGHGWLRAGPPGAQMELNRGLVVFPAEPNADHHLPSTLALWWEDEGTPGAEATGTVDVPTGTATMTGPRPPSSPTATVRAWPTPTP